MSDSKHKHRHTESQTEHGDGRKHGHTEPCVEHQPLPAHHTCYADNRSCDGGNPHLPPVLLLHHLMFPSQFADTVLATWIPIGVIQTGRTEGLVAYAAVADSLFIRVGGADHKMVNGEW